SPYPTDPWLAVPDESDPAPLFRAAEAMYGTAEETRQAPSEKPADDDPLPSSALDTDPKGAFAAGAFTQPQGGFGAGSGAFAIPQSTTGDNEGFLAPLKPSPREGEPEPFGPGTFTGPVAPPKQPEIVIPPAGKRDESTPSRGLFEEPVRENRESNTGETPAVADRTTPVRPTP